MGLPCSDHPLLFNRSRVESHLGTNDQMGKFCCVLNLAPFITKYVSRDNIVFTLDTHNTSKTPRRLCRNTMHGWWGKNTTLIYEAELIFSLELCPLE